MPVFMYSQKFVFFVSGWMDFLFSFREGSTYFFYLLLVLAMMLLAALSRTLRSTQNGYIFVPKTIGTYL